MGIAEEEVPPDPVEVVGRRQAEEEGEGDERSYLDATSMRPRNLKM